MINITVSDVLLAKDHTHTYARPPYLALFATLARVHLLVYFILFDIPVSFR